MKLVVDIETQNSFSDIGSRNDLSLLKVSVAVVYCYEEQKYYVFNEENMGELEDLFSRAQCVIGFNTVGFDLPVLQQYMKNVQLLPKKQIDILFELEKILGYKVSLDAVAKATLGDSKSSSGLDAIKMWKKGQVQELVDYCKQDVKLTKDIYEYGLKNKMVKFNAGWENYEVPVTWE